MLLGVSSLPACGLNEVFLYPGRCPWYKSWPFCPGQCGTKKFPYLLVSLWWPLIIPWVNPSHEEHIYAPQANQKICTSNSSSQPRAEVMARQFHQLFGLFGGLQHFLFWEYMSPCGISLLDPTREVSTALFWDSHVLACDGRMNGTFCSAGNKGCLQTPSETLRRTALFLYSQLVSLRQNSF